MSTVVLFLLGVRVAGRYGCHDNGMAWPHPSKRIEFPRVRDQVIACQKLVHRLFEALKALGSPLGRVNACLGHD